MPPSPHPVPGTYQPHVDGLRAVAVLVVLLFHAELGPFSGGFTGVDVFFVISGFLITGILLREQDQGVLSLARFYARRARRILPALLVVAVACVPPALLLLNGEELKDFGSMLAATSVGASNLLLAARSGYFDPAAELRPLLHTWSLAVEEQFYLLFPLLLLTAPRLGRQRWVALLVLLALLSLAVAEWGSRSHGQANFFLAPGRFWELLVGCLCACAATGERPLRDALPPAARGMVAAAGLVAVVAASLLFERYTPAPSALMLLPVLGAAAVVLYAAPDNLVGRLLAQGALVRVGLISYSIYLWHQPLLAFARLYLRGPLPLAWRWGIVLATIVLAALTWRWVEQPLRRGRGSPKRTLARAGTACGGAFALGLAGLVAAEVLITQPSPQVLSGFENAPRSARCFDLPYAHARPDGWACPINAAAGPPDFAVFGDSHALQLLEAFEEAARGSGRSGVFAGISACPPLLDVVTVTRNDDVERDCTGLNRRMLQFVRDQRIREVVLVSKWSYYTRTNGYVALGLHAHDEPSPSGSRRAFERGLQATLRAYAALGVRVHIVEQVPEQVGNPRSIYERLAREHWRDDSLLRSLSVSVEEHRRLQAFPAAVFRAGPVRPATIVTFDNLFCDGERCLVGTRDEPFYRDASHLGAYGARRTVPALTALLQRRVPQAAATVP